jgi:acetyl/propionyl-CoA carboxylase alpha subunit
VSVYYDPMLAKVIAYAPSREQSVRLLARALAESRIHGVVTNRDLLVGILREDEFLAGDIDTGYLTRHDPAELMAGDDRQIPVHALAAALANQAHRRAGAEVLTHIPSGWRNVPNARQHVTFQAGERCVEVEYRLRGNHAQAAVDGVELASVTVRECTAELVDLQVDGVRRVVTITRSGATRYADSALGSTTLVEQPRFPVAEAEAAAGSLVAPMPGTVVRVQAQAGDIVESGAVLVVLEAMKMEHPVRAPHAGVVAEVAVSAGQAVDQGAVLAVVDDTAGDEHE